MPPRQPLAPVDRDLDREGEPGLDARTHKAEDRIDPVLVVVEALALARPQLEPLRVPVAVDLVAHAGLDAPQHRDESLLDPVARRDLPRPLVLADPARRKVHDRAAQLFGLRHHGRLYALGHALREVPEVLEQHTLAGEPAHHPRDIGQPAKRSPKNETVETAQHSHDFPGVAV